MIRAVLGPIHGWFICSHRESDGCGCRKPAPGLIHAAAARFGVETHECVVVGDIGSDVEAAVAAGARAVLVPTALTRRSEIDAAPVVFHSLSDAVGAIVDERV